MDFEGFIGGSYTGRSKNLNSQRLVNMFVHSDNEGGKSARSLYRCPGLKGFSDTSNPSSAVRATFEVRGILYAVIGDTFYKIDSNGDPTAAATTLDTTTTKIWYADNDADDPQIMITDGVSGYIYIISTGVLTKITDADFPTPSSLTFQDGYFVVTVGDGATWQISALNDGTSWDALDFATAETETDNLLMCISDHRDLVFFGTKTTEYWRNTGASFPFERVSGSTQQVGSISTGVAQLDNSLFWIDSFGRVVKRVGYVPQVVSTRQIEYQLSQYSVTSDAIMYGYITEGHAFVFITFPTQKATWVYDIREDEWHERASYPNHDRHRSNCYAKAYGKHLVGDYANGQIYELDSKTYDDDGNVIRCERKTRHISNENKRIKYPLFELDCEVGVGLSGTVQGSDPEIMLRTSKDGGYTFGSERWRKLGKIGKYEKRVRWTTLGHARDMVFWVRVTDPVEFVVNKAYIEVKKGRN